MLLYQATKQWEACGWIEVLCDTKYNTSAQLNDFYNWCRMEREVSNNAINSGNVDPYIFLLTERERTIGLLLELHGYKNPTFLDLINSKADELATQQEYVRILDAGCGTGKFLVGMEAARRRGLLRSNVVTEGCDLIPTAPSNFPDGLAPVIRIEPFEHLSVPDSYYHFIVSSYCLGYWAENRDILEAQFSTARRILTSGGYMSLTVQVRPTIQPVPGTRGLLTAPNDLYNPALPIFVYRPSFSIHHGINDVNPPKEGAFRVTASFFEEQGFTIASATSIRVGSATCSYLLQKND